MKVCIITGASRGLGQAMARQRAVQQWHVLGLSRSSSTSLVDAGVLQWNADLTDPLPLAERLAAWIAALHRQHNNVERIDIIHNAALLPTPGRVGKGDWAEIGPAMRVGLEAVIVLTAAFMRATLSLERVPERRILLISSGNGRRALAGSATYSAIKAGMDHFARVLAAEEAERAAAGQAAAKVVALAPGIIDTDMQLQLRTSDPKEFLARDMFMGYHADGQLWSPEVASEKCLAFLDRPDFGDKPVADVRTD
jgi:NAD(P)-dependent dehydrogenase (short-subunit alcohol dehydrogenase family)